MSRIQFLEEQMDSEDFDMNLYELYSKELNELISNRNKVKAEQQAILAERKREEKEQADLDFVMALTEEQVDKMYMDSCLKYQDVNGMSFEKWYEQSLKYYTIDSNFVVHSKARSPNTVESVPCLTLAHAKYRILVLIRTKFNDHAVRGYDFAWEIESETIT